MYYQVKVFGFKFVINRFDFSDLYCLKRKLILVSCFLILCKCDYIYRYMDVYNKFVNVIENV